MTRDDIIDMALEAGFQRDNAGVYHSLDSDSTPYLELFAALVAAHEREECAKVCDLEVARATNNGQALRAGICAASIRARGNK